MKQFSKYLSPTEQDQQWGLHVITVGHGQVAANQPYPPVGEHPVGHTFNWNTGRVLDGLYFVYIPHGEGIFESAHSAPAAVKAGSCFVLFPGVWHRYKPRLERGWEEYWVGVKGPLVAMLLAGQFFNPGRAVIEIGAHEPLLVLFEQLHQLVSTAQVGYQQIAAGVALQIAGVLYAATQQLLTSDNRYEQLVNRARFLLRERLERPVSMPSLARELHVSYATFRRIFKQATGQSPAQYQADLCLQKATELLGSTSLDISEIAYYLGFGSLARFSKVFRSKTGVSPRQYRQQHSAGGTA